MFIAKEKAAELVGRRLMIRLTKAEWDFLDSHTVGGQPISIERSVAAVLAAEVRKVGKRARRGHGNSVAK